MEPQSDGDDQKRLSRVTPEPGGTIVERISAILYAFTDADAGVPTAELARRSNLPRSTVHRLAQQLIDVGVLQRDGSRINIGLRVFELGQLVPQQRRLRVVATPFLYDLRDTTRHTTNFAVLDKGDILFLDRVPGPSAPPLPFRHGGRHPAYATALGKAILAHLGPDQVDAVLQGNLEAVTPHTITSRSGLEKAFEEVRETGVAYDQQETQEGVYCVASPVFDRTGRVLGAISATGLSGSVGIARSAQAVHNASLNLSRVLRNRMISGL